MVEATQATQATQAMAFVSLQSDFRDPKSHLSLGVIIGPLGPWAGRAERRAETKKV